MWLIDHSEGEGVADIDHRVWLIDHSEGEGVGGGCALSHSSHTPQKRMCKNNPFLSYKYVTCLYSFLQCSAEVYYNYDTHELPLIRPPLGPVKVS